MDDSENLINTSKLLIYYIRMYIESLYWLNNHLKDFSEWDFDCNGILDAHLLYSRVLIEFVTGNYPRAKDRFAKSFFIVDLNQRFPVKSTSLNKYKNEISKQLVHITLDMYPGFKIKSKQKFEINRIANELVPLLITFFKEVPQDRIDKKAKDNALKLLLEYSPLDSSLELGPST